MHRSKLIPAFLLGGLLAACGNSTAPPASSPVVPTSQPSLSPASVPTRAVTSPASSAQTGPVAIALRWSEAINRGDAAGAAAVFADTGVFVGIQPCLVATPCIGPAAVLKRAQSAVASHATLTPAGTPQVAGDLVELREEV